MAIASGGGGRGQLNSEINVTPLVDVMLVLLVIFMITAPLLNTGVEIALPETSAKAIKDPEGKPTLAISNEGRLYIAGEEVEWPDLKARLSAGGPMEELQIEADKRLPYAIVVTAMAQAQEAGVAKLQLLSDPGASQNLKELQERVRSGAPLEPSDPAAATEQPAQEGER